MKQETVIAAVALGLIVTLFAGPVMAAESSLPSRGGIYPATTTPVPTPTFATCPAQCQCLTGDEAQQKWPGGFTQSGAQVCGYGGSVASGASVPQYCYCNSNVIAGPPSIPGQIPQGTAPVTKYPPSPSPQPTIASSHTPAAGNPMHLVASVSPSPGSAHINTTAHAPVAVHNLTPPANTTGPGPWDYIAGGINRLLPSPFAKEWYVSMPGPTASVMWWDWSMGSPQQGHTTPHQPGSSIGYYDEMFALSPTEEAIVSHGVPSISNGQGTILLNQVSYHFSVDPDLCVSNIQVYTSSGNWLLQNPDDPDNGWCSPYTYGENNYPKEYSGTIDLPAYEAHDGVNMNYHLKAGDVNAGLTAHGFMLISSGARFTGL